ncbi:2,3-bisphosphoglycerate-independent phosphoglycerate mutase [Candidatus Falkowbacteria bacterium]|nr:2,3-bisphosphoglycerate-independent phosphoglycerate mutase [Candidatus Falkowbacteria bacterium]
MGEKKNISKSNLPMILIILDGWGIAGPNKGNAIALAKTPTLSGLIRKYPNTVLCASGKCVGLPPGQVGNSEAGHMNIGAGRLVEQDAVRISKSINDGTFFKNPAFAEAIRHVKKNKTKLHLMGILSAGSSPHSDPDHILALTVLAKNSGVKDVYLHLFTDGRDSPRYAALKMVAAMERSFKNGECVASIIGRFYAMDRKKKWERSEKTYDVLTLGTGRKAKSPQAAIAESYNKGETDEFIEPYVMTRKGKLTPRIGDGDSVIFFNLRSDRARQLAKVFVQKDFSEQNLGSFKRKKILKNLRFVAMTDFGPDLDSILTAYPGVDLRGTLSAQLADLRQLYIAETEKYAHVTYFFNGGYANPVAGETRVVIPSPDVKSYDQTPTMRSADLSRVVIENLKNKKYDFTVLNFAAPDMVGHTGNLEAGIKCCSEIDKRVKEIVDAYLKARGTIIITADHGNVEEMIDLKTDEVDTEHSVNAVPFIIISPEISGVKIKLNKEGILGDIAPTILNLLGRKKPKEMTGKSLILNSHLYVQHRATI